MVRAVFSTQGSLTGTQTNQLVGLTDLELVETGGGTVLYAVTRGGGYMSAFDIGDAAGQTEVGEHWSLALQFLQLESTDLVLRETANGPQLYMAGLNFDGLRGLRLDNDGQGPLMEANLVVSASGWDLGDFTEMELVAGSDFGLASLRGGGLVNVSYGANNTLNVTNINEGSAMSDARASDMITVTHDGETYAFVTYGSEDTVGMFHQDGNGRFQHISDFDSGDGLWVNQPGAIAVTTAADGGLYVVVAASGTDSLSVLSVDADGNGARVVDHILDSLDTRFADVTHVTSVTIGDQDFVLAAGSDQGLSLFAMLPGGRLQHVESFEATIDTPLNGVTALEVLSTDDGIRVFVSTEAAPFLSELYIDLQTLGISVVADAQGGAMNGTGGDDILSGGEGADVISGGAGGDILMDGAGQDSLYGGTGQDTFFLMRDNSADTIYDFQAGLDRIDLSGFGQIFGAYDISVTSRDWGAVLRFGEDVLSIRTADGSSLTEDDFNDDNLIRGGRVETDPSEYTPGGSGDGLGDPPDDPPPPPPPVIGGATDPGYTGEIPDAPACPDAVAYSFGPAGYSTVGTDGANSIYTFGSHDYVFAMGGNDTVLSSGGNDNVDAGQGNDRVEAGADDDLVIGGQGSDTLYGSGGNDTLIGDGMADEIYGGGDDDVIQGGSGRDDLHGGTGADQIWGGSYADTIYGGDGNDWLMAGTNAAGQDRLFGEGGNDRLFGEAGYDYLDGGDGNDILDGGNLADVLHGGEGRDFLFGGDGFDRLFGGGDIDRISGGNHIDVMRAGEGNDIVWGGSGNDRGFGDAGRDMLDGGEGNDYLLGGTGNDTLIGGEGDDYMRGNFDNDTFVFHDNHGNDTIADFTFNNQVEQMDFTDLSGFDSFSDVLAAATQNGANVLIDTGSGNSILLQGIDLDDLDADNFLF